MTIQEENLQFGARMDHLGDKEQMIDFIVRANPRRVLDLGAGTGLVAQKISHHQISVDAVDHDFKIDHPQDTLFLTHYPTDIIRYVYMTNKKYDCIILSAVIHELSIETRKDLIKGLKRIADPDGCLLVIREPFYQKQKDGLIAPFANKEAQKRAYELSAAFIPENAIGTWLNAYKKHLSRNDIFGYDHKTPACIYWLNLAFAWSYGDDSWEREQHEYRFAYSYDELVKFGKKVLGRKVKISYYTHKDKNYIEYFRNRWLPTELIYNLEYTNACMFFATGNKA